MACTAQSEDYKRLRTTALDPSSLTNKGKSTLDSWRMLEL